MFIQNAKYIKVWEITEKDGRVKGNLSESEKNLDGEWINWYWTGKFVGDCKDKALNIQKGDMIEVIKGKIRILLG